MAKTVVFGGIIQYTTYTPANSTNTTLTCVAAEGVGKEYAINYLNATAAFDRNNDGTNERGGVAGGGIPSEPVIVIREGGVTGLVGTSGGAASIEVGSGGSRYKTFWYDE
jgi:type IV pilus assembly protein PilY1